VAVLAGATGADRAEAWIRVGAQLRPAAIWPHESPSSAAIVLGPGGSLRFTVTDDGAGFDTASTRHGTGLQGMAGRLAALGGALHIRSQPGHGTTLSGKLPVSAPGQP
jgi:glucose-6-phosphate-specific signal transduction histidine kinase